MRNRFQNRLLAFFLAFLLMSGSLTASCVTAGEAGQMGIVPDAETFSAAEDSGAVDIDDSLFDKEDLIPDPDSDRAEEAFLMDEEEPAGERPAGENLPGDELSEEPAEDELTGEGRTADGQAMDELPEGIPAGADSAGETVIIPDTESEEEPITEDLTLFAAEIGDEPELAAAADGSFSRTIYASSLEDNADLKLSGDTVLIMDTARTLRTISGDFRLTISGSSLLTMKYAGKVIRVSDLVISAPLDVAGGNDRAIYADAGSVVINSDVSVIAASGIFAKKDILINSGHVSAETGLSCLTAEEGSITVRSSIDASSKDKDALHAEKDVLIELPSEAHVLADASSGEDGIYSRSGNITIRGGAVAAEGYRGIYAKNGNISLAGLVIADGGNNPAIYAPQGTVTVVSGYIAASAVTGISGNNGVSILSGHVEADADICGIVSDEGSISIAGDVTASTHSSSYGTIWAYGDVTIHSGTISVTDTKSGSCIYSKTGNIVIEDGDITAKGAYGINARKGNLTLAGRISATSGAHPAIYAQAGMIDLQGEITAASQITGIWAYGNILFTDGSVSAKGTGRAVYTEVGKITVRPPLSILTPTGGTVSTHTIEDTAGDTAVYARIGRPVYTVFFDADGGEGNMTPVTAKAGTVYTLPDCRFTAPEGKRFRTWNFGTPGTSITIDQNYLVKAVWEDDLYAVTLNPGAGTGKERSASVSYGAQYQVGNPAGFFTAPKGKTFYRWQINGTDSYCFPGDRITITGNTVLTAMWQEPAPVTEYFTVTWKANGGTGAERTLYMTSGHKFRLSENWFEPPAGKRFRNWSVNGTAYEPGDSYTVTGNTVIIPVWSAPVYYRIRFNVQGHGTAPADKSVQEGRPLYLYRPADPSAAGYIFEGWYTEPACVNRFNWNSSSGISQNITLYAKWSTEIRDAAVQGLREPVAGEAPTLLGELSVPEGAHYFLTSITWRETASPVDLDMSTPLFEAGRTYYAILEMYTEDGYAFAANDDPMSPDNSDFDTFTINGGTSLIGRIYISDHYHCSVITEEMDAAAPPYYRIRFDANGGSGVMPDQIVPAGDGFVLPANEFQPPSGSGKVFAGWDAGDPADMIWPTGDMTVRAIWDHPSYTVSFDANGGGGVMAPEKVYQGDSYTLPPCPFTPPEGKEFGGWDLGAAGDAITVNADITVTAQWKDIPPADSPRPAGEISPENPAAADTTEAVILASGGEADLNGSSFSLLQAKGTPKSKKAVKLTWKRVSGATGYIIYGNKCGKNNRYQMITTVMGTSYVQKKLKKGTYYKYLVAAVNGSRVLAVSKTIHVATKGGKVGNNTKVKLDKTRLTLKVNQSRKVKATLKKGSLKVKIHRKVAYESSDVRIATVSKKGRITGIKKGTCYIYAYAQNGICAKVKVTVK